MTIRFYCEKCGKSLRADQEIIGRLTRCSKCGAKVRVPTESTRKSGERNIVSPIHSEPIAVNPSLENQQGIASSDVFDEGILSVLGDSGELDDLSDFDLGRFDPTVNFSKPIPVSTGRRVVPNLKNTVDSNADDHSAGDHSPPAPFTFRKKNKFRFSAVKNLSTRSLLMGGLLSIIGLLSLGGLVYWLSFDNFSLETSELYQSGMGTRYNSVLTELKRSQGALDTIQKAHQSKGLPSDELTQANQLLQRYAKMTEGHPGLRAAERQLQRGDEREGRKMFHLEIDALLNLKNEIDVETELLKERTFSSR